MTLSTNRYLRMATLCALYVSQGIPFGFVTITLAAYLAKMGVSVAGIGFVVGMTSAPWTFKFLWGPFVDTFRFPAMGRRRPWILGAQCCMALTIAAMIAIPDIGANITLLAALVCLHNVFASVQDVSTDALAVDLLAPEERGFVNGLMYGSSYLGSFIGGAGMGWIAFQVGLREALIAQVFILFGIMLLPLLVRERPGEKLLPGFPGSVMLPPEEANRRGFISAISLLGKAFGRIVAAKAALLATLMRLGIGALAVIGVVFIKEEIGWPEEKYVAVTSLALWAGLGGAVVGGFLADRFGARRIASFASFGLAATWITFAGARGLWDNDLFVKAMIFADAGFAAMLITASFAIFMAISLPAVAATQFSSFLALQNLSNTIGSNLVGPLTKVLSYQQIYNLFGGTQIALIILIAALGREADGKPSDQEPPRSGEG